MREIAVEDITKEIAKMCIQANHYLSDDMDKALKNATKEEASPLGKKILEKMLSMKVYDRVIQMGIFENRL